MPEPKICVEVERSVIASMLCSKTAMHTAIDLLQPSDFYEPVHKIIFTTMSAMHSEGKQIDLALLGMRLKDENHLEIIGGFPFLASLYSNVELSVYIEDYCSVVKKKSLLRQMSEAVVKSGIVVEKCTDDVDTALDEIRQLFFEVGRSSGLDKVAEFSELVHDFSKENLTSRKSQFDSGACVLTGISTGYPSIDRLLSGFGKSHLIVIAARPAMGKTTFALNLAQNVCKSGIPVAFFSLEMTATQLSHKVVCSECQISARRVSIGDISHEEIEILCSTVDSLRKIPMFIDDHDAIKVSELKAKARRMVERDGVGMIFIDYLQLLKTGNPKHDKYEEVTAISRELKLLAKELRVPVVALCQLSRKSEERIGHRPMMSDLRDSGSIEQDSDVVILMHRRDYYDPYDMPGQAEIVVAKNRHGETGTTPMRFDRDVGRFAELFG